MHEIFRLVWRRRVLCAFTGKTVIVGIVFGRVMDECAVKFIVHGKSGLSCRFSLTFEIVISRSNYLATTNFTVRKWVDYHRLVVDNKQA